MRRSSRRQHGYLGRGGRAGGGPAGGRRALRLRSEHRQERLGLPVKVCQHFRQATSAVCPHKRIPVSIPVRLPSRCATLNKQSDQSDPWATIFVGWDWNQSSGLGPYGVGFRVIVASTGSVFPELRLRYPHKSPWEWRPIKMSSIAVIRLYRLPPNSSENKFVGTHCYW